MALADIANDLIDLCRQGRYAEAIDKHYADTIVSVEPVGHGDAPARMEGIEAIRGKTQWWLDNFEAHGSRVEGPFLGENQFAVRFHMDVTEKATGKRSQSTEMALYTVANDKIVMEEFYYNPNDT